MSGSVRNRVVRGVLVGLGFVALTGCSAAGGADAELQVGQSEQELRFVRSAGYDDVHVNAAKIYKGQGARLLIKYSNGEWDLERASHAFWGTKLSAYGNLSAVPAIADYDGDGIDDLSVKDPSNHGTWYIDYSHDGFGGWNAQYSHYGENSVALPADYDGDGRADLSVKDSSNNGTWYIDYSSNGFHGWDAIFHGYGPTSIAVPADYDGDGRTDLSVKDKSNNGTWYIDYSSNGFGGWDDIFHGYGPTSTPVPGDYDGDRRADLSVFDGTTWYIDYSANGFHGWDAIIPAAPGCDGCWSDGKPLPGDFDNDGRMDIGLIYDGSSVLLSGEHWVYLVSFARDNFHGWTRFNVNDQPPPAPAAPSGITLTPAVGSIAVKWQDNSTNEDEFIVYYKQENASSYSAFAVSANSTATTITGSSSLTPDTTYCVKVASSNGGGESPSSEQPCTHTLPLPTPPPTKADLVPSTLSITPFPNAGTPVTFSWSECNVGGTNAGTYKYRVLLDQVEVKTGTRTLLAHGGCISDTITKTSPAVGQHQFDVVLDIENSVQEASESNNAVFAQFHSE